MDTQYTPVIAQYVEAQFILPVHEITQPLAQKDSGDYDRFNEAADRNIRDLRTLSVQLNVDFIPKVNLIAADVNTVIANLDVINDAANQAQAAANSAVDAANNAAEAAQSAADAETAKEACESIQDVLTEGATVDPTPNVPMKRDALGRSQVNAPEADLDIANRGWTLERVNEAIAALSGGLKTPIKLEKESDLPDITTAQQGDNYAVEDLDITAPGFQGKVWYNENESTTEWQVFVDRVQSPDGVTIVFDADAKLSLADSIQEVVSNVSTLSEAPDDGKNYARRNEAWKPIGEGWEVMRSTYGYRAQGPFAVCDDAVMWAAQTNATGTATYGAFCLKETSLLAQTMSSVSQSYMSTVACNDNYFYTALSQTTGSNSANRMSRTATTTSTFQVYPTTTNSIVYTLAAHGTTFMSVPKVANTTQARVFYNDSTTEFTEFTVPLSSAPAASCMNKNFAVIGATSSSGNNYVYSFDNAETWTAANVPRDFTTVAVNDNYIFYTVVTASTWTVPQRVLNRRVPGGALTSVNLPVAWGIAPSLAAYGDSVAAYITSNQNTMFETLFYSGDNGVNFDHVSLPSMFLYANRALSLLGISNNYIYMSYSYSAMDSSSTSTTYHSILRYKI